MLADDGLFLFVESEKAAGVGKSPLWMRESMETMGTVAVFVPVIEIKIMKKRTDDQGLHVGAQSESFVKIIAQSDHVHHMVIGTHCAVLTETFHGLGFFCVHVIMKMSMNFFQFRRG